MEEKRFLRFASEEKRSPVLETENFTKYKKIYFPVRQFALEYSRIFGLILRHGFFMEGRRRERTGSRGRTCRILYRVWGRI
jgi:hypothetical protein